MFNLAPIFKRQAKPAAKRTPPAIRRAGKGRKELTTITADPLLADPMMAAPMLTTWDVTGPDGVYLGAFQGSTPDDAILSYVATQGYASIDDAALAMGFADAMTFAASFIVTETLDPAGMDPMLAPVDPLAAPAALSRRRRKFARKMADDFPAILDFLAGFTPEQIDAVVTANDWGMIGAEWDGTAWVGVYADGMNEPLSEKTVAEIAYQLGYVVPAATLSDEEMIEDDEETPAEIARRRRSRKSDAGTVIAALGTVAFGGMLAYSVGALISDAYESLMAWWNEPSSEERTATLQADLVRLRDIESQLIAQAAAETNEIYLRETNSALGLVQNAIVALEAELANPSGVLSARSRRATARRLALKAAFTVADATTGDVLGTYDATTSDDAILSYVAQAGYETIEAAAAGMGFATVEEFLASISVAEGSQAEAAPAETPAETLSRRHRMMRKATFDVADPTTGEILGTFDAGTIDDAILSYAAQIGFGSADEAAAAAGLTVEEWLATFTITEAAPAADAPPAEAEMEITIEGEDDEEDMPPAAASRRGRKSIDWATFDAELNRLIPGYGATDDLDWVAISDDIASALSDIEIANPDYANDPTWQGLNALYAQLDAELASMPSQTLSRRRA
jgi:hypothetical protein